MKKHTKNFLITGLSLFVLGACHAQSLIQPATISKLTDEGRQEITARVKQALKVETVTIGQNAFATSNILIIERKVNPSLKSQNTGRRLTEMPPQFVLYLDREKCVLLHKQTNVKYSLNLVSCQRKN